MRDIIIDGIHATLEGDGSSAILLCPPHPLMGGNRHDIRLIRLSERLSEEGFLTLRFDYRKPYRKGLGEIEDARICLKFLEEKSTKTGILGYSFGSLVASNVADGVDALLLLSPLKKIDEMELKLDVTCPVYVIYALRDQIVGVNESEEILESMATLNGFLALETDHFYSGKLKEMTNGVVDFFKNILK